MAANRARGEASITLGGLAFTARVSLDTLARLEDAFGVEDFTEVFEKVFGGKVSARHLGTFLRTVLKVSGAPDDRVEQGMADASVEECLTAAVGVMAVSGFKSADADLAPKDGASPLGAASAGSSGARSASATSGSGRKRSGR